MLNIAVFCVLLCYGVWDVSGATIVDVLTNTPAPSFPSIFPPTISDSNEHLHLNGTYNINVTQQIIYVNGPLLGIADSNANFNRIDKELSPGYRVTNEIGAHKLHLRLVPWNKARNICVAEGGHLAVIRSDSEEKIVLQMMLDQSIEHAWIGFHDNFEEGDWISVLDEPLGSTGWARWSKSYSPNPDNGHGGGQNCAHILKEGGMDDAYCNKNKPFICKVSTY